MKIRVGTRDSRLAMIQTEIVIDNIRKYDNSIEIEIVPMKTTGDKILNVTLDKIGGKGLFVKELDEALLMDQVDMTVHSFKDMPMEENPELPIIAVSKREDPRDVMILSRAIDAPKNPDDKDIFIGTSSKRRCVQLRRMGYKNIKPIRGNITSRLRKLDEGEFDAIVIASAGVKRSGLQDRISKYFTVEEIIPAACQGNLTIQGRAGKEYRYLQNYHDPEAYIIAQAERAFVRQLDGGCSTPTAAYGVREGEDIHLKGLFLSDDNKVLIKEVRGSATQPEALGIQLANMMLAENRGEERNE